jgi:hypothetical protein
MWVKMQKMNCFHRRILTELTFCICWCFVALISQFGPRWTVKRPHQILHNRPIPLFHLLLFSKFLLLSINVAGSPLSYGTNFIFYIHLHPTRHSSYHIHMMHATINHTTNTMSVREMNYLFRSNFRSCYDIYNANQYVYYSMAGTKANTWCHLVYPWPLWWWEWMYHWCMWGQLLHKSWCCTRLLWK